MGIIIVQKRYTILGRIIILKDAIHPTVVRLPGLSIFSSAERDCNRGAKFELYIEELSFGMGMPRYRIPSRAQVYGESCAIYFWGSSEALRPNIWHMDALSL